jgi:hypothetical protein
MIERVIFEKHAKSTPQALQEIARFFGTSHKANFADLKIRR